MSVLVPESEKGLRESPNFLTIGMFKSVIKELGTWWNSFNSSLDCFSDILVTTYAFISTLK